VHGSGPFRVAERAAVRVPPAGGERTQRRLANEKPGRSVSERRARKSVMTKIVVRLIKRVKLFYSYTERTVYSSAIPRKIAVVRFVRFGNRWTDFGPP